jgi:hypothetical protein
VTPCRRSGNNILPADAFAGTRRFAQGGITGLVPIGIAARLKSDRHEDTHRRRCVLPVHLSPGIPPCSGG